MTDLHQFRLVLLARFYGPFAALLRDQFKQFHREEGGYLFGRFRDGAVEIDGFYHDHEAQSSYGDIQLSTGAFDHAEKLASRETGRVVLGTWHLHPPGYGAGYSATDEECLFVDRMVLQATDLSQYDTPWVHLIVPGIEVHRLRAYTLDVRTDHEFVAVASAPQDLPAGPLLPSGFRYGLLIRTRTGKPPKFYPINQKVLAAAQRNGCLAGFWRVCSPGCAVSRWELLFVENFVRKVHEVGRVATPQAGQAFSYCRVVNGESPEVQRFDFHVRREKGQEEFVPMPVELELTLQNPDTDASQTFTWPAEATIATLIGRIQEEERLPRAPFLWTLLRSEAAEQLRERTCVEEFGKVYLPEDLTIAEVWSSRDTPDVPIYWESPEIAPETVLRLRTHRFATMGYDLNCLREQRVVVAGLGLLGCGVARLLATVAVGRLTLIDCGRVDWVDVYRQSLYEPRHVGRLKAEVAAEALTAMGSECEALQLEVPSVLVKDVVASRKNLAALADRVKEADAVVGSLDSYSSRAALQVVCRIYGVPLLAASLDYLPQFDLTQGSVALYGARGACYGCGSGLKLQKDRGGCTNAPLEFPGIVNSLAAKILIDALTDPAEPSAQVCRVYQDYRIEFKPLAAAEGCEVCSLSREAAHLPFAEWSERLLSWLIG